MVSRNHATYLGTPNGYLRDYYKPDKTDRTPDDLVCYCFGYTANAIEQDFIKNSRSLIIERIAAEKKAGGCDCASKNPKGR